MTQVPASQDLRLIEIFATDALYEGWNIFELRGKGKGVKGKEDFGVILRFLHSLPSL